MNLCINIQAQPVPAFYIAPATGGFTASLDFSDARNSQYIPLFF